MELIRSAGLTLEPQTAARSRLMDIRRYETGDEASVIDLWTRCGLTRPWNDPSRDIARKLTVQPELFLVGVVDGRLVATVMAGFDGHRGWVNYLAVDSAFRKHGFGRALMRRVKQDLAAMGRPKLNMQIRGSNGTKEETC